MQEKNNRNVNNQAYYIKMISSSTILSFEGGMNKLSLSCDSGFYWVVLSQRLDIPHTFSTSIFTNYSSSSIYPHAYMSQVY